MMPEPVTRSMQIRRASSRAERLACEQLIVAVYRSRYGVTFSEEADPDRKREPLPDHYVLGEMDGEVVAAAGLYTRFTYAQRFGALSEDDLLRVLTAAGHPEALERPRVEYTKLVVRPGWEGLGIGRRFLAATHCRNFLTSGSERSPLILASGKVSVFQHLYQSMGIHTRTVKPFPVYRSHAQYCSAEDPMESRLSIPELDIDPRWFGFELPGTLEFDAPPRSVRRRLTPGQLA